MANLKEKYEQTVVPELEKAFGLKNPMQVPRLQKIVVNMAFGIVDKDTQKSVVDDLEKITGQKPALCPAKKSVANFKLREGMVIGAKVTLRRRRQEGEGGRSPRDLHLARLQPLLPLRPPARLHPQVQALPPLLPRARAPGQDPRRHQGVLVAKENHNELV